MDELPAEINKLFEYDVLLYRQETTILMDLHRVHNGKITLMSDISAGYALFLGYPNNIPKNNVNWTDAKYYATVFCMLFKKYTKFHDCIINKYVNDSVLINELLEYAIIYNLKEFVKDIIKFADLDEDSMKIVCGNRHDYPIKYYLKYQKFDINDLKKEIILNGSVNHLNILLKTYNANMSSYYFSLIIMLGQYQMLQYCLDEQLYDQLYDQTDKMCSYIPEYDKNYNRSLPYYCYGKQYNYNLCLEIIKKSNILINDALSIYLARLCNDS